MVDFFASSDELVKNKQLDHESTISFFSIWRTFSIEKCVPHGFIRSYNLRGLLEELEVENASRRQVFSAFPSCSQMPVVFCHSVMHASGFFIY